MRVLFVFIALLFLPTVSALAELPRAYMDTTFPTQTGVTTLVPTTANAVTNGQAFQAALNAAQPGDTIVLPAGAKFQGNFVLPIKPGMSNTSWILIRSSAYNSLPPQGTRVQVVDKANMPELYSPNVGPVIDTAVGSPASSGYWFTGLYITENSNYNYTTDNSYSWPNGIDIRFSYGLVQLGTNGADQDSLAEVPQRFVFDRCYFYGGPTSHVKRAVLLNSAWTAVVDSRIEGMKGIGQDTQALLGYNGPGPFKIVNNHLEGAGENVMFGGGDPSIVNLVPSDIEIRRNYIYKPPSWRDYWLVKNSYETKNNQRLLLEGNVIENNWAHGQVGFMLVLKSANQDGGCPLCVSQDVTIRNNIFKNSDNGFALHGGDAYSSGGVLPQSRVDIENNLFLNMGQNGAGKAIGQLTGGAILTPQADHRIVRNTFVSKTNDAYPSTFVLDGGSVFVASNLLIKDNLFVYLGSEPTAYGFLGSGTAWGQPSIDRFTTGTVVQSNVAIGIMDPNPVSGMNYVPKRTSDFVNAAAEDYRIAASSPLKGSASAGTDPGADWAVVLAATSGAVTGIWGPCTVSTWSPNSAVLCGSVAQTSNCGTTRVTSGGVTCGAQQTCTNNQCTATALLGDRNGDGRVDAIDLAIVFAAIGQTSPSNDLNGDGTVNVFDLVLLTRNWS